MISRTLFKNTADDWITVSTQFNISDLYLEKGALVCPQYSGVLCGVLASKDTIRLPAVAADRIKDFADDD